MLFHFSLSPFVMQTMWATSLVLVASTRQPWCLAFLCPAAQEARQQAKPSHQSPIRHSNPQTAQF